MKFTLTIGVGNEFLPEGDLDYQKKVQAKLDSLNLDHERYFVNVNVEEVFFRDLPYRLESLFDRSGELSAVTALFSEAEILHATLRVYTPVVSRRYIKIRSKDCFVTPIGPQSLLTVKLHHKTLEEKIVLLNDAGNHFLRLGMLSQSIFKAKRHVVDTHNYSAAVAQLQKSLEVMDRLADFI